MKKHLAAFIFTLSITPVFTQSLYLSEDFGSNDGSWFIDTNPSAYLNIENGFYYFESLDEGIYDSWADFDLDENMNYSISCDAIHATGVDNYAYGMFFAGEDADNNYLFLITATGYFSVGGTDKGSWFDLTSDWIQTDALKKGDFKANRIGVKQLAGKWQFIINGKIVFETQQRKYYGNDFGFSVQNFQAILFDNYTIYTNISQEKNITETQIGSFADQLNKLLSDYKNNFSSAAGNMHTDSATREARYSCLLKIPGIKEDYFTMTVLNENFDYNGIIASGLNLKDAIKVFNTYEKEIAGYPFKTGKMLENKFTDDRKEATVPRSSDWVTDTTDPAADYASASMVVTLKITSAAEKKNTYNVLLTVWRGN